MHSSSVHNISFYLSPRSHSLTAILQLGSMCQTPLLSKELDVGSDDVALCCGKNVARANCKKIQLGSKTHSCVETHMNLVAQ